MAHTHIRRDSSATTCTYTTWLIHMCGSRGVEVDVIRYEVASSRRLPKDRIAVRCSVSQCCSMLQCVAVRCSALQCVAVRCSEIGSLLDDACHLHMQRHPQVGSLKILMILSYKLKKNWACPLLTLSSMKWDLITWICGRVLKLLDY